RRDPLDPWLEVRCLGLGDCRDQIVRVQQALERRKQTVAHVALQQLEIELVQLEAHDLYHAGHSCESSCNAGRRKSSAQRLSRDRGQRMNMHQFYAPFLIYFRTRRMRQFEAIFKPAPTTRIIDIGGYELNWTLIDAGPQVLLVNLEDE